MISKRNSTNQNPSRLKWLKLYFCFEMRNFILELKIRLKWNSKILSRVLSFYWIKKSNFPFMWIHETVHFCPLPEFANKLELGRINRNTRTGNVKTSKTSEKCQKMSFLFEKFQNSKQSLMQFSRIWPFSSQKQSFSSINDGFVVKWTNFVSKI